MNGSHIEQVGRENLKFELLRAQSGVSIPDIKRRDGEASGFEAGDIVDKNQCGSTTDRGSIVAFLFESERANFGRGGPAGQSQIINLQDKFRLFSHDKKVRRQSGPDFRGLAKYSLAEKKRSKEGENALEIRSRNGNHCGEWLPVFLRSTEGSAAIFWGLAAKVCVLTEEAPCSFLF